MAGLLNRERRDRARAERGERQRRLLEAARRAVLSRPYTELSLESLDRAAGLRQGAASMYFGSLEGVVLRLLREEIEDWLSGLESELAESATSIDPAGFAALVADSLAGRRLLRRLSAVLPIALERRTVEMDRVQEVEEWRLERLATTGRAAAVRCPELSADAALELLRRALVLAAAVEPLAHPPSGMALAANDPDLAPLYPDGEEELRSLLHAVAVAGRSR